MRVYFSPRATRDLTSIFLFLDARSKNGARNVMRAIRDGVALIAEHPQAWQATNIPAIRVKLVRQYPFKIFYRLLDDRNEIEIVHVRHSVRGKAKNSAT
jgi:plasmid stabilization system protein ParE